VGAERDEAKVQVADPGTHVQMNLLGDKAVPPWLHPYVYKTSLGSRKIRQ